MEDDIGVIKLLELIFVKKFQVTAEMTVKDSSFPPCLLINYFPQKLRCVLILKQAVLYEIWRKGWPRLFDENISDVKAFTEGFLKSIFSACFVEHVCMNKPFDSFINTCAMVRVSALQMSKKTGLNFSDFNIHIVLEFYEQVLKKSFLRVGGFQRLVGYINEHQYLKWKMDLNDDTALDDPLGYFNPYTAEKLEKEKKKEKNSRSSGYARNLDVEHLQSISDSMAEEVFLTASVKLFPVEDSHDSNRTDLAMNLNKNAKTTEGTIETEAALKSEPLDGGETNVKEKAKTTEGTMEAEPLDGGAMNLKEKAKTTEETMEAEPLDSGAINLKEKAKTEGTMETETDLKSEPLDGGAMNINEKAKTEGTMETEAALKSETSDKLPSHLSSNFDSKANHAVKQRELIPPYEKTVETVIKHNCSKSSDLSDCDKQLLERVNRIFDRLKDGIKSLIEVLDEYDKE